MIRVFAERVFVAVLLRSERPVKAVLRVIERVRD